MGIALTGLLALTVFSLTTRPARPTGG